MRRIEVTGFNLAEVGSDAQDTLWNRDGFPLAYLAMEDGPSRVWRQDFIRTLIERDLPQ